MPEATIERLGRAGDGIAGALRLPLALPGERWRAEDGAEPELLSPATERVAPPCPRFGRCGGCTLQHASDEFLADWKTDTIRRALAARGIETHLRPILTSPPQSRRRAVFSGRRTRNTVILGFHARRSEALVDSSGCLLVRPEILAARPVLARLTGRGATRSSVLRLTVTAGPAGLDVDVAGGRGLDADLRTALAAEAEAGNLARLSWDGETVAARRPPFQMMGGARVVPPPGAFLQATSEGEQALVGAVGEAVAGRDGWRICSRAAGPSRCRSRTCWRWRATPRCSGRSPRAGGRRRG